MRRGIFLAPFDELSDPRLLAELAALAERRGWDGFFLWDHVAYDPPVQDVADPWVALAAMACATQRITLGPLVTPLARRRWQKLLRETQTLDRLSGGRLVLGVGLGGTRPEELDAYDEPQDLRARAALLDERLARLTEGWGARPIPVWVAGRHPNRRPLERAARWDGVFPILLPGPEALAGVLEIVGPGHEIVITDPPGADWGAWAAAGATWGLTGWGPQPREAEVRAAIEAGPG